MVEHYSHPGGERITGEVVELGSHADEKPIVKYRLNLPRSDVTFHGTNGRGTDVLICGKLRRILCRMIGV